MGQYSRILWLELWIGAGFVTALTQTGDGGLVFMLSTSQSEAPGPLRSLDAAEFRLLTVGNATILRGGVPGRRVHGLPRRAATPVPVAERADRPGGVGGHGEPRRHPHRLTRVPRLPGPGLLLGRPALV